MSLPLDGLRVIDLTRLLPGGYATLVLADLGADVVKVEEPGRGDYIRWSPPFAGAYSAAHVALNRNKRSVALDLRSEDGKAALEALVAGADVLVESFRPGVMDRLGFGPDRLRADHPRLVYCAITGYGVDGPRAGEAGHDIDYMAYSGALALTGEPGGRPVIPGLQVGDLGGGGLPAVVAILAALVERSVSGRGSFCDVAMADGVFSWLSIHAAAHIAEGTVPERGAMPLSGLFPCYRVYPASDGWLAVGALEPRFWEELCRAVDRPDLAPDGLATGSRRDEVIAELEALFATRTRAEWTERFRGRDVCVAPVNDLAEAFADEQLVARGMVVERPLPDGRPWRHLGNPIRVDDDGRDPIRRPPPALGEHTREVLSEARVDPEVVGRIVAGPS